MEVHITHQIQISCVPHSPPLSQAHGGPIGIAEMAGRLRAQVVSRARVAAFRRREEGPLSWYDNQGAGRGGARNGPARRVPIAVANLRPLTLHPGSTRIVSCRDRRRARGQGPAKRDFVNDGPTNFLLDGIWARCVERES